MIADAHDSEKVAARLKQATARINKLAYDVGHARQVKEFIGDLKKNLLAKYMVGSLREGQTSAAAETIARANEEYKREFAELEAKFEAAEMSISQWQAEQCAFDAARSLLSFEKYTIDRLDG